MSYLPNTVYSNYYLYLNISLKNKTIQKSSVSKHTILEYAN